LFLVESQRRTSGAKAQRRFLVSGFSFLVQIQTQNFEAMMLRAQRALDGIRKGFSEVWWQIKTQPLDWVIQNCSVPLIG
jgi:hypothetical protein